MAGSAKDKVLKLKSTLKAAETKLIEAVVKKAQANTTLQEKLLNVHRAVSLCEGKEGKTYTYEQLAQLVNETGGVNGRKITASEVQAAHAYYETLSETEKASYQMRTLLEAELEQAEVLLAVKALADDLQTVAERLAKMQVEDVMPLVDQIREVFGPEKADSFNQVATDSINNSLNTVKKSKESISDSVRMLEGEGPANDMALGGAPAADPAMDATATDVPADGFDGAAAAAGQDGNPVGRELKV